MQEETNTFLNDDCLEQIFNHLPIKDLLMTGEVSIQFRRISQYVVKTRHPMIKLNEIFPEITLAQYRQIMKTFGKIMKGFAINAINLEYPVRESKFLKILIDHFSQNSNLKTLELENFYGFSTHVLNYFSPIFEKLTSLTLTRLALPVSIPTIIRRWNNLEELRIIFCHKADHRSVSQTKYADEYPLNFKSNLKILELTNNSYLSVLPLITEAPRMFPKLEELSIHPALFGEPIMFQFNFINSLINATKLPTIKSLKVDLNFKEMTNFLEAVTQNLPQLQILEINYATFTQNNINQFKKLKHLKGLKLFSINGLKKQHIKPIVREMAELSTFLTNCKLNTRTLVHILRVTPKLTLLDIEMHSKHAITEVTVQRMLRVIQTQQRKKALKVKIYNHNFQPVTTNELRIVSTCNNSPFIHITRWP